MSEGRSIQAEWFDWTYVEDIPNAGKTDLRLVADMSGKHFTLPEDATITGFTVKIPPFDPEATREYWGMSPNFLWVNGHGPFPREMREVKFDADGKPLAPCTCERCQET